MQDPKPIASPVANGKRMSLYNGVPLSDPSRYRSIVGALQYLTITHLNIAFSVNQVCQFMRNPTNVHWVVVKRILHYLKHSYDHSLVYRHGSLHVVAYSDANYAGDPDNHYSTGDYGIFLGPNFNFMEFKEAKYHLSLQH